MWYFFNEHLFYLAAEKLSEKSSGVISQKHLHLALHGLRAWDGRFEYIQWTSWHIEGLEADCRTLCCCNIAWRFWGQNGVKLVRTCRRYLFHI